MKLENIKSKKEFYEFADVWYQRTHRLREASEDKNRSSEKRDQARSLFIVMMVRCLNIHQIAIKLSQVKPSKGNKGSFTLVNNDYDKEPILK